MLIPDYVTGEQDGNPQITSKLLFPFMFPVAVSSLELEGRKLILDGGSRQSPESTSPAMFCLALVCNQSLKMQREFGEVIFFFSVVSVCFQVLHHHHHLSTVTPADL